MRTLIGGLALAALLAACGGSTPAAGGSNNPACSGTSGKHHVHVLVEHASGKKVSACVGFDAATIGGDALMKKSHIEFQTQSTQYGPAVCQVDSEPAHYDKCLPANAPYWSNWQWNGSAWAMAETGYSVMKFTDHQALGWVYTSPTASPAPPPPPPSS